MIRSREQLTDKQFRERSGLAGDAPIHLLFRPTSSSPTLDWAFGWGIHIDELADPDNELGRYSVTVGDSGIHVSAVELRAMAQDILDRVPAGAQPCVCNPTHRPDDLICQYRDGAS